MSFNSCILPLTLLSISLGNLVYTVPVELKAIEKPILFTDFAVTVFMVLQGQHASFSEFINVWAVGINPMLLSTFVLSLDSSNLLRFGWSPFGDYFFSFSIL